MYTLITFLGVSAIVVATPGPDTAMTIRNALLGGRSGGVFTAFGIAIGQLVWAFATSVGIVALLIASGPIFATVKYAGAAYLIYLGSLALREAIRPSTREEQLPIRRAHKRLARFAAFRQGMMSDLGNPKMAVFFASLLPQFIGPGEASFWALFLRGCIFACMTFAWLAGYTTLVAMLGDFLRRGSARRILEGVTGLVLVGLGLHLVTEGR